ncbi:ThuA domain-containing protein [Blautia liquoris]|mgnify:CR=1 FL=1|uniref:ThuA domain-containing protein n=1 Tax=Blautia liquoris TaxID=2779518 RepID=A0A7M2RGL2_9FIRM|nr:ThuA domain-containing protein [Blautia liquoris]QOV18677.1 ThuA domain-containing protein [Blautia liquoris]
MDRKINVTIYNENFHESTIPQLKTVYPESIHGALRSFLEKDSDIGTLRIATLEDHEEIMTQEVMDDTDVLIWWGHAKHPDVSDEVVDRCAKRVLEGMGLIALHSAHASKLFQKLLGTETYWVRWREAGEKVRLWNLAPNHPITQGIGETFVVPHDETYGEPFGIPNPDELIFLSWYQGGEVFRSGCTWHRGEGKIFYLQDGHETFPIYYQPEIQKIITNAVKWACPIKRACKIDRGGPNTPALETYELEDHDFLLLDAKDHPAFQK